MSLLESHLCSSCLKKKEKKTTLFLIAYNIFEFTRNSRQRTIRFHATAMPSRAKAR